MCLQQYNTSCEPISFPEYACSRVMSVACHYITREQAYSGNEIGCEQVRYDSFRPKLCRRYLAQGTDHASSTQGLFAVTILSQRVAIGKSRRRRLGILTWFNSIEHKSHSRTFSLYQPLPCSYEMETRSSHC